MLTRTLWDTANIILYIKTSSKSPEPTIETVQQIFLCKTCYLVGFSHRDIIRPSRQGENAGVSQIRNESIKCLCRDEQRPPTIQNCDLQWNSHTRVIAETRIPRFSLTRKLWRHCACVHHAAISVPASETVEEGKCLSKYLKVNCRYLSLVLKHDLAVSISLEQIRVISGLGCQIYNKPGGS